MSNEKLQNYAVELANEALWNYEFINVAENYEELTDDECIRVHDLITKKVKAHIPTVPQIIRTLEELYALDPDTLLIESYGKEVFAYRMQVSIGGLGNESMYYDSFPAAVIATGAQVRAAREAVEQGNGRTVNPYQRQERNHYDR